MRVMFLAEGNNEGFDGALTHDWQVSTDHESDALPTAPHHLSRHLTTLSISSVLQIIICQPVQY